MGKFQFIKTNIDGVYIIEPTVFQDERGYFMETFSEREFENEGINIKFVQDNESKSVKGVLRGLHFQTKFPQGKLVRVVKGTIFDVAVDLRVGSPTFGKYKGVILSEDNKRLFYIPEGFAHGFLVLSDEAVFNYKCTNFYAAEYESGIVWNDTDLNIEWPIKNGMKVILSNKDKALQKLDEFSSSFIYEEKIYYDDITLNPIEVQDIEIIRLWRNEENYKNTFINTNSISSEDQLKWYKKYKENIEDRMFTIVYNNTKIGTISLYNINYQNKRAEVGRLLIGDLNSRGNGIGLKAIDAICKYGFNRLGLSKITLEVFEDNIYARNVDNKAGFQMVGQRNIDERTLILMELIKKED